MNGIETNLLKQINYLSQVSTSHPHTGSSYGAHKDWQVSHWLPSTLVAILASSLDLKFDLFDALELLPLWHDQLRGRNSNAGEMDQTWSTLSANFYHSNASQMYSESLYFWENWCSKSNALNLHYLHHLRETSIASNLSPSFALTLFVNVVPVIGKLCQNMNPHFWFDFVNEES